MQPKANAEEGVKIWEQIRQVAEEGSWVQFPEPAEGCQEEGVHTWGGGQGGQCYTRWLSWLRPFHTSWKVAGSIPDVFFGTFIDVILPAAL